MALTIIPGSLFISLLFCVFSFLDLSSRFLIMPLFWQNIFLLALWAKVAWEVNFLRIWMWQMLFEEDMIDSWAGFRIQGWKTSESFPSELWRHVLLSCWVWIATVCDIAFFVHSLWKLSGSLVYPYFSFPFLKNYDDVLGIGVFSCMFLYAVSFSSVNSYLPVLRNFLYFSLLFPLSFWNTY